MQVVITYNLYPSIYYRLSTLKILGAYCRDYGLQPSASASDDAEICAVCLERACTIAAEGALLPLLLCFNCFMYLKNHLYLVHSMYCLSANIWLKNMHEKLLSLLSMMLQWQFYLIFKNIKAIGSHLHVKNT